MRPYNAAAVDIIRQRCAHGATARAIAFELGWPLAMLERIARANLISLTAATLPSAAAFSASSSVVAPAAPRCWQHGKIVWDPRAREVRGRGMAVALTAQQCAIFNLLWRHSAGGAFLTSMAIASAPNVDDKHARYLLQRLRARLKPTGVVIETQMGRDGGYRLAVVEGARR